MRICTSWKSVSLNVLTSHGRVYTHTRLLYGKNVPMYAQLQTFNLIIDNLIFMTFG